MKRRRKINLRESYQSLTPEEKNALGFVSDPGVRSGLANLISSMRKTGKQINLQQAATQLSQFMTQQGQEVPVDLQRLSSRQTIQPPPQAIMNAPRAQQQQPQQQQQGGKLRQRMIEKGRARPVTQMPTSATGVGRKSVPIPYQSSQHFKPLEQTAQEVEQEPKEEKWQRRLKKKKVNQAKPQTMEPIQTSGKIPQTNQNMDAVPLSQHQRRSSDPMAFQDTMYPEPQKESKMIKTKSQLNEAVKKAVLKEQQKKLAKKILKEQVEVQKEAYFTARVLLTEGPLSSVWQGIKSAGSAMGDRLGLGSQVAQDNVSKQRDERTRKITDAIAKAINKAMQQRQKFNSQTLKNSQMMTQYHEHVLRAFELYKRFEDTLGPAGMQVNRQINDLIKAIHDDLVSEVSQIKAMLSSLGKKDDSLDSMLKQHQEEAAEKREQQADLGARLRSSTGMTKERIPASLRMKNIRPQSTPTEDRSTPKEMEGESLERVRATDEANYRGFKKKTDELTRQIMREKDPEKRKELVRRLYDQTKRMKGLGIRSKAGMTALGKANEQSREKKKAQKAK